MKELEDWLFKRPNEYKGNGILEQASERWSMNPEIRSYITRSVTDIARKCHCKEDKVWAEMSDISTVKSMEYGTI